MSLNIKELSNKIADDFVEAAKLAGIDILRSEVEVNMLDPHRPPSLPKGMLGVYVFMLGDSCLKVGKAGPKSSSRFCSHHYGTNARSTLANSLLKVPPNGVEGLNVDNVKQWICDKTTRINFLIPTERGIFALSLLEAFVQCRMQPVYEGFASQREAMLRTSDGEMEFDQLPDTLEHLYPDGNPKY
jgi:hypothetical protein